MYRSGFCKFLLVSKKEIDAHAMTVRTVRSSLRSITAVVRKEEGMAMSIELGIIAL